MRPSTRPTAARTHSSCGLFSSSSNWQPHLTFCQPRSNSSTNHSWQPQLLLPLLFSPRWLLVNRLAGFLHHCWEYHQLSAQAYLLPSPHLQATVAFTMWRRSLREALHLLGCWHPLLHRHRWLPWTVTGGQTSFLLTKAPTHLLPPTPFPTTTSHATLNLFKNIYGDSGHGRNGWIPLRDPQPHCEDTDALKKDSRSIIKKWHLRKSTITSILVYISPLFHTMTAPLLNHHLKQSKG